MQVCMYMYACMYVHVCMYVRWWPSDQRGLGNEVSPGADHRAIMVCSQSPYCVLELHFPEATGKAPTWPGVSAQFPPGGGQRMCSSDSPAHWSPRAKKCCVPRQLPLKVLLLERSYAFVGFNPHPPVLSV